MGIQLQSGGYDKEDSIDFYKKLINKLYYSIIKI